MRLALVARAASLTGRAVAWGTLVLSVASCTENHADSTGAAPPEMVKLSAAPTSVPRGGTLTLREPLGYTLCTSAIEKANGQTVHIGRICTRELRTLQPGRSASYDYELSPEIAAGRYRILANAERMNSGTHDVTRSNYFDVR